MPAAAGAAAGGFGTVETMRDTLNRTARWFDLLNRALAAIACAVFVSIALLICAEIVTRATIDVSNPWLVEISEIALLYITFLAAAWVLGNDRHVALDLLLSRLGARSAAYLHVVLSLAAALACLVVAWFGILTAIDQYQNEIREPTIMAPLTWWITAVVPFGFILLCIQFLRRAVRAAAGLPLAVGPR